MTPERWALVEALFTRAAELPAGERGALLDETTGDDPALRAAVEDLLEEHDRDPAFLEPSPPWLASDGDDDTDEELPERIGEYRIVRMLGRGGMARVYLAERAAQGFSRDVALKVMHRGLDTGDLVRRFRAERQILANLDHPNIARLLDVGATDDGLPYLVMEYVEGTNILRHADGRRLSVRARLELFRTVCSAVQHAHQNLVVHRDLKPGNILVTEKGVPKLLDFGIAKVLDREPGDPDDPPTRAGLRLLTPEYSAPEQILGDVITTACDVHALGLLLYQLLTGRHPYARRGHDGREEESVGDLTRRIVDSDPPPPSAGWRGDPAAAESAAARSTVPDALGRTLSGDLDTIVLKALRKEPDARYASAQALSEDVHRYLVGLPVEARAATLGYKLRKFVRRNPAPVTAGVALFLLLGGFSAVTAHQTRVIREEADRVSRERDKAQQVRAFLLETFGTRGPDQAAGGTVTVRELLDRQAATLDSAYAGDAALRGELSGVLAEAYERLGLYDKAEPLARRAVDDARAVDEPADPDLAVALDALGWIQRQQGHVQVAETTLDEAVRVGRQVFPPEGDERLARALNDLGAVREAHGDYDGAEAAYRESLAMRRRLPGDTDDGIAVTTSNLAVLLYRRGDLDGAAKMTQSAIETLTRLLGADHERTVIAKGNLAAIRAVQGDHEGAAAIYAEILARNRRVLGPRHAQVAYALTAYANELLRLHRPAEAEPLLREALSIGREVFGPRHERVAASLRVLGDAVDANGRPDEALGDYQEALGIVRETLGPQHDEVAVLRQRIGKVRAEMGQTRQAEADYRAAIAGFRVAHGADHYLTADATLSLAELLLDTGRTAEARKVLDEVTPVVAGLKPSFSELKKRLAADRARAG